MSRSEKPGAWCDATARRHDSEEQHRPWSQSRVHSQKLLNRVSQIDLAAVQRLFQNRSLAGEPHLGDRIVVLLYAAGVA